MQSVNTPKSNIVAIFILSLVSLVCLGCGSSDQDSEIEAKRIVGVWATEHVNQESLGFETNGVTYSIYRQPDQSGKIDVYTVSQSDKEVDGLHVWSDGWVTRRISKTHRDGRVVEIERVLDGKVVGTDVFEIVDDQNTTARFVVDNTGANQLAEELGSDTSDTPDESSFGMRRVIDQAELTRIEAAIDRHQNK